MNLPDLLIRKLSFMKPQSYYEWVSCGPIRILHKDVLTAVLFFSFIHRHYDSLIPEPCTWDIRPSSMFSSGSLSPLVVLWIGIVHANLNVSIAVNISDSSIVLMIHSFIGLHLGYEALEHVFQWKFVSFSLLTIKNFSEPPERFHRLVL